MDLNKSYKTEWKTYPDKSDIICKELSNHNTEIFEECLREYSHYCELQISIGDYPPVRSL